jgi:hypothetical protein
MKDEGSRRRVRLRRTELHGGGADLISALPEDVLLEVLVRLRCARAAARTSLLSRRWRGRWTQLPDLIFRNATLARLLPTLTSIQARVSLLDIRIPSHHGLEAAAVPSLFHAAAGLSPVDFTLSLPRMMDHVDMELPRFHRAASIQLYAENLRLTPPGRSAGFPALERLSLSGCSVDLAALVLRCPCLRVLWVAQVSLDDGIDIRSESLQELHVRAGYSSTDRINVEAPVLKKLTMLFRTKDKLNVSVVAPILEKVSWECSSYSTTTMTAGFGPWGLSKVSLHTAESLGHRVITGAGEDTCLQLSNVNVLSLQMKPCVCLMQYLLLN